MEGEADVQYRYPIGTVARRTGLSVHLLRAWERRYAVVTPGRSDGGTRLYSNADVFRLKLLRRAVEAGHPIGQVARLPVEELLVLAGGEEASVGPAGPYDPGAERHVAMCLEAAEGMDGERIHEVLHLSAVTLGAADFRDQVVLPLLRRVGDLWEGGEICPAHEHLVSVGVHRVLTWLLGTIRAPLSAPVVVVTTPSGHRHELGALLAALEAAREGWRVVYLGPDLPARDIVTAAGAAGAAAVILSLVRSAGPRELRTELETIRSGAGEGVAVLVGGEGAERYTELIGSTGAVWLPGFDSLRAKLRELAPGAVPGAANSNVERSA